MIPWSIIIAVANLVVTYFFLGLRVGLTLTFDVTVAGVTFVQFHRDAVELRNRKSRIRVKYYTAMCV